MAVSAFAAGIISSGFSASTGLNIQCPIPQARRCSGCGLDEDQCANRTWRAWIKWIDDRLLFSWFFGGSAARVREYYPCPMRRICEACGTRFHAPADHTSAPTTAHTTAPTTAAAAAAAAATTTAPAQAAHNTTQLSIKDLFSMTSMVYPQPTTGYEDYDDDQPMRVDIHMLKMNKSITLDVNINSTVADVREQAASKLGLPRRRLMLIFNGSQLEDHEEIKYLGIRGDCTIFGMKCSPGEQMGIFELDPSNLDPQYDYDFTNKSDDGSTYLRGGQVYQRPYGWKRYAVKVHGEYENDTWLGDNGIRTHSSPGEWAVSYHGTEKRCVKPILEAGYKIGQRERFGRAVYSSPNLEKIDEHRYTKKFTKDGKRYKFALQNRVDPNHLEVIPPEKTGHADFPYWLCPMQDPENGIYHVRPYGILTREL